MHYIFFPVPYLLGRFEKGVITLNKYFHFHSYVLCNYYTKGANRINHKLFMENFPLVLFFPSLRLHTNVLTLLRYTETNRFSSK